MKRDRPFVPIVFGVLALGILSGCAGTLEMLGAGLAYEHASLPEERVHLDLAYRSDDRADAVKHKLDLFLPESKDEPFETLVFVHGGGWTAGDRSVGALGIEPIRNLGRFYAARGYAVVVPSYRLQPGVPWTAQIEDVADVIAWVDREIATFGGDPRKIHLGGHSAGAWLAAWTGLADEPLARIGLDRARFCSLVLVSGAAYDLEDEETYVLGASRDYFDGLFSASEVGAEWSHAASIRAHVDLPVPPSLVLSAAGEPEKFHRQGDLIFETLRRSSPASKRLTVPGQNHQRILVSMSLEGDAVSEATLAFMETNACSQGSTSDSAPQATSELRTP